MNQKIIIAIGAVLIIAGGVLYYYGGNNYGTPTVSGTPNPLGQNQISIKNFAFSPEELSINKGDTVTWTNDDSVAHDIVGSGFQSPIMSKGQSFNFTFNTAGTVDYICGIHSGMKGKVIVK